jgi:hypothetical protein
MLAAGAAVENQTTFHFNLNALRLLMLLFLISTFYFHQCIAP